MEIHAIKNMVFMLGFFSAFTLSVYFFVSARSKERLALIEKGMELPKSRNFNQLLSRLAVILIGISFGILTGYWLGVNTQLPEPVSFSSMILLFSGLSIILHQFIINKTSNG